MSGIMKSAIVIVIFEEHIGYESFCRYDDFYLTLLETRYINDI